MQKQIFNQIEILGGRVLKPRRKTLQAQIEAIRFPHVLYDQNWDVYGIDEFFEKHRTTFDSAPKQFYDSLEAAYFNDDDSPRGQSFWKTKLFTPMTSGTGDFDEWSPMFADENMVNLQPIHDVVGDGPLEFLRIMYSYGFPDSFYICLQDPKPANPTVFGTDHEVFFREYSVTEPLSKFLRRFLTKSDFRKIVKEYLTDKFSPE